MNELLKNSTLFRILFTVFIVIIILILIVFLFFKLYVPFGGVASNKDREDYKRRASNYRNGKFYNENDFQMIYKTNDKSVYVSDKNIVPVDNIPVKKPNVIEEPNIDDLNITWLGHSTILMNIKGMNVLIDPVFTGQASPVSFAGPSRYVDLPIEVDELPKIDLVVISHDHYDHLDYKTIKLIDDKVEKYVVPLGVENHLERWKVNSKKIINMAWWEEININGMLLGCTPARHYSSRKMIDSYSTLWASYVFITDKYKVYFSGDSGYDNHFKTISSKYGEFDISLLDSGQYDLKWKSTHMVPEESVQAGIDLKSKVIMPIHNGAFVLSSHPWDDPLERFSIESEKKGVKYIIPMIGETINYGDNISTNKWWKDLK